MISKKNTLIVVIISLLSSVIINPYIIGLCKDDYKYCFFGDFAHSVGKPLFIISLPLLLLTLLVYKMREEVYQAWFRFVRVWIPLSVILIALAPEYGYGLLPIDKGRVSLALTVLLLIISLFIITIKYFSLKSSQNNVNG